MNVIFDGALKATLVLMQLMPARTGFCPLNVVVARIKIHCKTPLGANRTREALFESSNYQYHI